MALRQKLNNAPALVAVAVLVLIGVAVWVVLSQGGNDPSSNYRATTGAFYTVDDGKTWFVGDAQLTPPFDHQGKEAVRVNLFICGEKEVVGYLERFTPEAKAMLEKAKASASGPPANLGEAMGVIMNGKEVKRPGDAKWVRETNRGQSLSITQIKCEDGSLAKAKLVNK